MEALGPNDLWEKEAYEDTGRHLGTIEVVVTRKGQVRRIGIRLRRDERVTYFQAQGARLIDGRVVLAPRPPLEIVPE